MNSPTPELEFTRHEVDSTGSLAHYLVGAQSHRGIYWLEFADGAAYIGQSIHATARLSKHRRTRSDIVAFSFASVGEEESLDMYERSMITRLDTEGVSLRNIQLTKFPHGRGDLQIEIRPGRPLSLPYSRTERRQWEIKDVVDFEFNEVTPGILAKYRTLSNHKNGAFACCVAARYIAEIFPAPIQTQRTLWTISAMPSTSGGRLLTINAGGLEVLFIRTLRRDEIVEGSEPGDEEFVGYFNLDLPDHWEKTIRRLQRRHPDAYFEASPKSYKSGPVLTATFTHALVGKELLEDEEFLDLAYALAIRHLRGGKNPNRNTHNPFLVFDAFTFAMGKGE